jgi:anti-sigma factor RsiW
MADFPAHTDPTILVPELALYLKGELPPLVKAAFEAHLPICDRCRKAVAVAQTLFPSASRPEVAAAPKTPQELFAQMDAQLEQVRARNRRLAETRSRNALWALAVVALFAGIGAYSLFMLRRPATLQALANPLQAHRAQLAPEQAPAPTGSTEGAAP